MRTHNLSSDEVLAEARDLYARWPKLNSPEKRQIVGTITEKIVVGTDEVEIHLCYTPSPPPSRPSGSSKLVPKGQRDLTPALPCCHLILSAEKPKDPVLQMEPQTWGEHLRRQPILLGLLQKEAASEIGVSFGTIIHWERNRTTPPARMTPRITLFLGYGPWTVPETPGERFRQVRVGLGLSQKAAARLLGIDPVTVTRWELGERQLSAGLEPRRLVGASCTPGR